MNDQCPSCGSDRRDLQINSHRAQVPLGEGGWRCPDSWHNTNDRGESEPYDSRPDTHEHIAQVRGLVLGAAADLTDRAHIHDRSKLESPEVEIFDEFTPKLRDSTYGSDEYKGYLEGMGEGLQHHYAVNDHHPEHFVAESPNEVDGIGAMDLLQLTEMLCDWIAATRRHADGDIYRSIEQNGERFGYGEEIQRLLRNSVARLLGKELGGLAQLLEPPELVAPSRLVFLGDPMPMPRTKHSERPFPHDYVPTFAANRQDELALAWQQAGLPCIESGPIVCRFIFAFARPATHFNAAGQIFPRFLDARPGRGSHKKGKPRTGGDIDNLEKLVLDALNPREIKKGRKVVTQTAGAWRDDGQVADVVKAKFYIDQVPVLEPQTIIEVAAL